MMAASVSKATHHNFLYPRLLVPPHHPVGAPSSPHQARGVPGQVVQQQLRDEFESVQEVLDLTAEELLAEMQTLQLAVMYEDEGDADVDVDAAGMPEGFDVEAGEVGGIASELAGLVRGKGSKKKMGAGTEEFLVQQVGAWLFIDWCGIFSSGGLIHWSELPL